ncbi:MAG: (4Fe-4S)-binding protein [Bacteroidota bacterium]
MKPLTKHYSNGEVTIVWKNDLCIHSTICWKQATGLPEVFNPAERPWINPEGASTEKIISQVDKCPSGALSYFMNAEAEKMKTDTVIVENIIEVSPKGPLLVYGNVTIKDKDGSETRKSKVTALCRCGASGNKPYCDGSHNKINFED